MKQYSFLTLFLSLFLVIACQAPKTKETSVKLQKTPSKEVPEAKGPAKSPQTSTEQAYKKAPKDNLGAKLELSTEPPVIDLINILGRAEQIEYMFYVNPQNPSEKSVTSDTKSKGEIKNFQAIISTKRVKKPDCVYMGNAVFSDAEGNILMDTAFNLSPDCHHIRLISEGETYYHKLSGEGVKFLSQFYAKMMKQQKEYDQQKQK